MSPSCSPYVLPCREWRPKICPASAEAKHFSRLSTNIRVASLRRRCLHSGISGLPVYELIPSLTASPTSNPRRTRMVWLAAPALLTALLAFFAGGFFPGATAIACIAGGLALVARLTTAERPWEGFGAALGVAIGRAGAPRGVDARVLGVVGGGRAAPRSSSTGRCSTCSCSSSSASSRGARATCGCCCAGSRARCARSASSRSSRGCCRDVFNSAELYGNDRLTFPLTYWNAMGIFAALGLVLALHVTSSDDEPAAARVAAAAAFPPVATVLYFTFSRGGIAAAVIGLALFVLLAHPRGLAGALLAIVPASRAGAAGRLRRRPARDVALRRRRGGGPARAGAAGRRRLRAGRGAAARCWRCGSSTRACGASRCPRTAAPRCAGARRSGRSCSSSGSSWRPTCRGASTRSGASSRAGRSCRGRPTCATASRAPATTGGSRTGASRATASRRSPLHGSGAGTYRLLWERGRPAPPFKVIDGHSLYFEVAAELGVARPRAAAGRARDAARGRADAAARRRAPRPRGVRARPAGCC